jgi:putative aldouronate transport system permease protein
MLLAVPGILYFAVFRIFPAFGNFAFALIDFHPLRGFFGSAFVGLKYFERLFSNPELGMMMRNTFIISGLRLIFAFPVPVVLALLMNDIRNEPVKSLIQNVIYLPHFISWVVVATITVSILAPGGGLANQVIALLGGKEINFLIKPELFRPILVVQGIWKEAGWGTVIYLAALSSVDPNLYEAAEIDGCNRMQKTWHITVPAIMSTVVVVFLLNVGRLINENFQQIYLMMNPLVAEQGEVFETFVFRIGLEQGQFGYGTAVGLFKSVVALVMVVGANSIIRRFGQRGIY